MIGPLLVADGWTFSETEVSHKKSRNNLTPPRAITIKLEPLIFIEKKKAISHVFDASLDKLRNLQTRLVLQFDPNLTGLTLLSVFRSKKYKKLK